MAGKKEQGITVRTAEFVSSASAFQQCPPPKFPEFAFIGRSNVGKSSLINMLCRKKELARTSSTPGKTQLINHFIINDTWYLVDLPGYGFAKVSRTQRGKWEKMIKDYFSKRENLYCVFVLVDSRIAPMNADVEMINRLGASGIPMAIVYTKTDKVKAVERKHNQLALENLLKETWEELPPHFVSSAETGLGRDEILSFIESSLK